VKIIWAGPGRRFLDQLEADAVFEVTFDLDLSGE
jgi:hypothetical protein